MTWNPFDWTGGPFLLLYLLLAATVFLVGFREKSMIGPSARGTQRLSYLELAYLSGGAPRLADAVLLSLTSEHCATIDASDHRITVTDQSPLTALVGRPISLPFEPDMTRHKFQATVDPIVERVRERLQKLGYCPSDDQMTSFRKNTLPFVVALLLFGTIKVIIGEGRHHPVGFLVFLLFVTIVAAVALAARPRRTRAGTEVLEDYLATHDRAARAPLEHELLLAVALSGPFVLAGTAHASVYTASRAMKGSADGGGCGGGGGGGGGGGCGGCS